MPLEMGGALTEQALLDAIETITKRPARRPILTMGALRQMLDAGVPTREIVNLLPVSVRVDDLPELAWRMPPVDRAGGWSYP